MCCFIGEYVPNEFSTTIEIDFSLPQQGRQTNNYAM